VFGKEVTAQYSTITMNTYAYVGGAVALLPLTLWEAHISRWRTSALGPGWRRSTWRCFPR
jgi:hypothetical protein